MAATGQAHWFALAHQEAVFCCRHQEAIISHTAIKHRNIKSLISTFISKLSNDEGLYLDASSSDENTKASIQAAKYIIEVERKVDDELQSRYFIESLEHFIVNPDDRAISLEASPSNIIPASKCSPNVAAQIPKQAFDQSSPSKKKVKFAPISYSEQVYLEVHVKDIYGHKNPVNWKGSNAFTLFACKRHQPPFGCSLKWVQVLRNPRQGQEWGGGELRKVTRKWLKGGRDENWGT